MKEYVGILKTTKAHEQDWMVRTLATELNKPLPCDNPT